MYTVLNLRQMSSSEPDRYGPARSVRVFVPPEPPRKRPDPPQRKPKRLRAAYIALILVVVALFAGGMAWYWYVLG